MLQSWLTLLIDRKRREAEDIYSFDLVAPDGSMLPPFEAGSHIDVRIAEGLVRQYSLLDAPADRARYRIAVLRSPEGGGGSLVLTERFAEGGTIQVGAPRNLFPLANAEGPALLFAGGIGITPILCMAGRLAASGKPFVLHYAGRSRSRTAFIDQITSGPLATSAHLYFDDEPACGRLDPPALLANPVADSHVYVCGPTGFMTAVLAAAAAAGWSADQLHREYFAAPAGLQAEGDQAFDVQIASTGAIFTIPADRSVTSVLADHGVEINVSCEQGVCGTCLTGLMGGEPDHRDEVLTEKERAANTQFTPCCSRARTPLLILDL